MSANSERATMRSRFRRQQAGPPDLQIPSRFVDAIALHLLRNLRPTVPAGTPLLLGIHGPAGEGKTLQTEAVLARAEVKTVLLSGGQFESGTAGEPAELVRGAYIEAATLIENHEPAVLLLNDADAAIGDWGELTQYTVNTQNVVTELMHLADYPTRVGGRQVARVPVLMTGNDFTRLYQPLCRAGRMEAFRWELDESEREAIVISLFPGLSRAQIRALMARCGAQPLSFWAAVRRQVQDVRMLKLLSAMELSGAIREATRGAQFEGDDSPPAFEEIEMVACHMLSNGYRNHLAAGPAARV